MEEIKRDRTINLAETDIDFPYVDNKTSEDSLSETKDYTKTFQEAFKEKDDTVLEDSLSETKDYTKTFQDKFKKGNDYNG